MPRCFSAGAVIALAFTLVAGSGAPARAAADDLCTTVSTSDVAAALGAPVTTTRRRMHGDDGATCTFHTARITTYAVVTAIRLGSAAEATSTFHTMIAQNTQLTGDKQMPLHGIGDDAALLATMVYTRKGSAIYTFSIADGARTARSLPKSEQLAKATLAHVTP